MVLRRSVVFITVAVWVLLGVGSLVTTTGSGLSIPDWPLAYSRLIPPTWEGGVAFEYGHRVVAGLIFIGLTILVGAAKIKKAESVIQKWLALVWVMVFIQALLGGVTVLLELPKVVSISHAGLAQATFLVLCLLVVYLYREDWFEGESARLTHRKPLVRFFIIMGVLLYIQIILGALTRHFAAGLAVPDFPLAYGHLWPPPLYMQDPNIGWKVLLHMIHRMGGFFLLLFVLVFIPYAYRYVREYRLYRKAVLLTGFVFLIQFTLGALVVLSSRNMGVVTAHVMFGALTLGVTGGVAFLFTLAGKDEYAVQRA